ncbi:MAG: hypothetical protein KatS3mg057_2947 [Herpetosiphonaceae bacterium]|nr:MAG: hypothetical protein KatS3mg057_2947 [Herpetosiphonaceae bacterium]
MMRLGTIGNVWRTVKEIDVQAIREEAEQPLQIVLVGDDELRAPLARLLRDGMGTYRYPALGPDPLQELWLPLARERQGELSRADLLILVLSAQRPLRDDEYMAYEKLIMVDAPLLVVVSGGFQLPLASPGTPAPDWSGQRVVYLDRADGSLDRLSEAIVELLPDDRRLAAARRLAGLRPVLARMVVGEISRSNAMYALTSGIPQLVPILNIPLVAADMIVLTKNQALMVYRLALAMGAPADFTAQMQEIMPVIGGGLPVAAAGA